MLLYRQVLLFCAVALGVVAISGGASAQSACPPGSVLDASGQCVDQDVAYGPQAEPPQAPEAPPAVDSGTHIDVGWTVVGAVTFSLGYAASVIFGVLRDDLFYIPVAGGLVHALIGGADGALGLGLSLFLGQSLGLVVMIFGLSQRYPNDPPPAEASLLPEVVGGPGELGLGLRWRF